MKYLRQTVSVFVFTILLSILSSLIKLPISNHDKYFCQTIFIFAIIIIRCRACHIALFLNVITDILNDLQVSLKQHQTKSHNRPNDSHFKRENTRYLREIYSNMWLIKTMLSGCFGWSILTYLFEFSIELINSSYWLFINVNSYGSNDLNTRKIKYWIHHQRWSIASIILLKLKASISDILLYNSSIGIVFWYFCMLSEKCQNLVNFIFSSQRATDSDYYKTYVYIQSWSIEVGQLACIFWFSEVENKLSSYFSGNCFNNNIRQYCDSISIIWRKCISQKANYWNEFYSNVEYILYKLCAIE